MSKTVKRSKPVDPALAGAYVAGLQAALEIARAALVNAHKQQDAESDPLIKRMWREKGESIAAIMINLEQRIVATAEKSAMVIDAVVSPSGAHL